MNIPGLGSVTEEEMRLAMEFRNKMGERMAAIVVESTALGGKVKVQDALRWSWRSSLVWRRR